MISLVTLGVFSGAVLLLLLSPGPNMAFVISQGVTHGWRGGVASALGIGVADLLLTALTAMGVTALVASWPPAFDLIRYAGVIYLLWLAFRLARAPASADKDSAHTASPSKGQAFFQGAAVQTLNPKAWLVALSGVGLFVIPMTHGGLPFHTALAWFCAVSLLACLLGVGCWALLGQFLRPVLSHARHQRLFNRGLAGMLVLSIAGILAR